MFWINLCVFSHPTIHESSWSESSAVFVTIVNRPTLDNQRNRYCSYNRLWYYTRKIMNWVTYCVIPRGFLMRKTQFTLNIDTIALNQMISGKLFRTNREGIHFGSIKFATTRSSNRYEISKKLWHQFEITTFDFSETNQWNSWNRRWWSRFYSIEQYGTNWVRLQQPKHGFLGKRFYSSTV